MKSEMEFVFSLPNDEAIHPSCATERGRLDPKKVKAILSIPVKANESTLPTTPIVKFFKKRYRS